MKKLNTPIDQDPLGLQYTNFFEFYIAKEKLKSELKDEIIAQIIDDTSSYDKTNFYPLVCQLLSDLKLNCKLTRDGDTNNRSDAYIIDLIHSIPIEIKSPTEVQAINNKSVRQAIENKIVLLSRQFYPTTVDTTSLVVGYLYPAERSGVIDLVDFIYNTFGISIGLISLERLLQIVWSVHYESLTFDRNSFIRLKGVL